MICTRAEVSGGFLTGRLIGRNCYGEAKCAAVREHLDQAVSASIYAYADHPSDDPLLTLANHPFCVRMRASETDIEPGDDR
ncbi:MAG: hypothetical protein KatS3mg121_0168 [Gammaproteobacteria bacterium]|nr:MAG: hypothetical protein KatS3mg121_0168 [Gammaproteobacteria bacterium]